MLPGSGSKDFILSLTLTEVVILLFFLLLFAAFWEVRETPGNTEYTPRELEEKQDELEKKLEGLVVLDSVRVDLSKEDFTELMETSAQNIGENEDLKQVIEKVTALVARKDSVIRRGERTIRRTQDSLADTQNELRECNIERTTEGWGYPPCWSDEESGSPEYIFLIRLRGDSLEVAPNWPGHRSDDVQDVSGAQRLANATLSRSEFRTRATPVLRWSQNPAENKLGEECRHFVIVEDTESTSKTDFKQSLLLVEDYFFKYLRRN